MIRWAPAAVALCLGCGDPAVAPEAAPGDLVEATAWAPVGPEADPFPAHRPADATCSASGWRVEGASFEVHTGECHYLAAGQPLLRDVQEGAPIAVQLWHQPLYAETAAEGHLALAIGGDVIWERTVAIPAPPAVIQDEVAAPRPLRAGEAVVFHIHNHGANTWNLGAVFSCPEAGCD